MDEKTKKILFFIFIILVSICLCLLLIKLFPAGDYITPLFIVLIIHIYLEDMFKNERNKKNK